MQIIAFLTLVVLILLILEQVGFSPKIKYFGAALLVVIIVVAVLYERNSSKKGSYKRELVLHFTQGGELLCGGVKVDLKHFNYENGTESFVAKKEFENLKGTILSLKDCEKSK